MASEYKSIVRSVFEIQDRKERTSLEVLSPEFVAHLPGAPPLNAEGLDQREAMFHASFSDTRHKLVAVD